MTNYPYGTPNSIKTPYGPLAPDLTRSTTFAMKDALTIRDVGSDELPGEFYPRYGHPNGREFESLVAELEQGDGAVAFASGMAAFHAVFCGLLSRGDVLLCSRQVYGGVHALIETDLPRFGIGVERFDPFNLEDLHRKLQSTSARLVHIETPVNPICRVVDLERTAEVVHAAGALLCVDGTFLPPPLQRPLIHGADIVIHSATKFLGGHSDCLGGIVTSHHEVLEPLERFRRRTGGILSPDTAWLYCRSLRTLELRVRQQSKSAAILALWLQSRAREDESICAVHYPGLPGHPDRETAEKQMETFGSMLAFAMPDLESAMAVYNRFRRIGRAVSLGGIETISSLPLHTSHASSTPEELAAAGIEPGLIRISVGLEPVEEIQADLDQAFSE